MTQKNKTALLMTALTLGLYFSGFMVFMTPLPFIFYQLKYRESDSYAIIWPGLLFVVAVYVFGANFFHVFYNNHPTLKWLFPVPVIELVDYFTVSTVKVIGVTYFVIFVVMSLLISRSLKFSESKAFRVIFFSVIGIFLVGGVVVLGMVYPFADKILADYTQYMDAAIQQFIVAQEQAGMALDKILLLKSNAKEMVEYSYFMLPFAFLLFISFLFVLNLVISKRFFKPYFKDLTKLNLTKFKIPFYLVWVMIGSVAVLLVDKIFIHSKPFFFIALNVILSLGMAYVLQGFAVVIHFLDQKKIFGFLRFFIYLFMLFLMQSTVFILALIGFADNWLDIRNKKHARIARNRNRS